MLFDPKWFYFASRLWKISRFSVFEDWPESSGPSFKIYGVLGCKDSGAGEPLHERTLLHPLPHEEQRSAAWFYSNSSSWYQKLYSTAVPKYSGEQFKMLVMNLSKNNSQKYVIPQYDLTAFRVVELGEMWFYTEALSDRATRGRYNTGEVYHLFLILSFL